MLPGRGALPEQDVRWWGGRAHSPRTRPAHHHRPRGLRYALCGFDSCCTEVCTQYSGHEKVLGDNRQGIGSRSSHRANYRAREWYSSLGIFPQASDIRFVKLYMLAISTISQQAASERPNPLRRSRSSGEHSRGSLVILTA
jgi:hypothetical protein